MRASVSNARPGVDFLVMEFVEGESLAARLARGPLSIAETCRSAIELASALDRAHSAGIVHRDIKPANVMVTRSGIKLLDFGLAKPSAGLVRSDDATGPGAGALLYEMVSGRKAFEAGSVGSLIAAIVEKEPPRLSSVQPLAPPALERIVATCLAKQPDERWQTARDLMHALQPVRDGAVGDQRQGEAARSRARRLVPVGTEFFSPVLRQRRRRCGWRAGNRGQTSSSSTSHRHRIRRC
jgi:serine/threonine protein kinase